MKATEIIVDATIETDLQGVAEDIKNGAIAIIPTDTLFGIVAVGNNKNALKRLLQIRKSPRGKKLTKLIPTPHKIYANKNIIVSLRADKLIRKFWPGPLSLIFKTKNGESESYRCPNHYIPKKIMELADIELYAPSANITGASPIVSFEEASSEFGQLVDYIIKGDLPKHQQPSTVVDLTNSKTNILREGVISKEEITKETNLNILFVCSGNTCRSPMAEGIIKYLLSQKLNIPPSELPQTGYTISSAGTLAIELERPAENAIKALKDKGFDISRHLSRQINLELIEKADIIYVMTKEHKNHLIHTFPLCRSKISLLSPSEKNVPDPYGGNLLTYKKSLSQIRNEILLRLEEL